MIASIEAMEKSLSGTFASMMVDLHCHGNLRTGAVAGLTFPATGRLPRWIFSDAESVGHYDQLAIRATTTEAVSKPAPKSRMSITLPEC